MKIAVIVSEFNKEITDGLLSGALRALKDENIPQKDYKIIKVPGAFEIPFVAGKTIKKKIFDGIVALGCVLKGDTDHYEAICDGVTFGIQKVSIENNFPLTLGVIMCRSMEHAKKRSGDNNENKGYESTKALIKIIKTID